MDRLDGEVALVTGASSGIGEGGWMLAGYGAAVALVARREEELRRVAGTIEASGGTALVVPADVERDDDLGALPGRVRAALGPVDILVNAAGVAAFQPVQEIDPPTLYGCGGSTCAPRPCSAPRCCRRCGSTGTES